MDKEPKTRQEKKGHKYKEVYNSKTIRLKESLLEKQIKALFEKQNISKI
jgi:hypothetical protein